MKREKLAPGEAYHIFNRGVGKQKIFHDRADYQRFLFLILYFQSPENFPHVGRSVKEFVKHPMLDKFEKVVDKRVVELWAFCIMPNHFHLIIKEVDENGISSYMQRILNSYGKYYNTKYGKSGHVFQGSYRLRHIEDDRYLTHLSAYIHRNPRELEKWRRREEGYEWSSYQDFIGTNRWGKLLEPEIVLGQFGSMKEYHQFVKASPTKLLEEELEL